MPYFAIRLIILPLAFFAQIYLYLRFHRFIRSLNRSEGFKSKAIGFTGVGIALLFVMNGLILFRPILWVDPPFSAQLGLFYPPTIWTLGSIFSALLLFLIRVLAGLVRMIFRLTHPLRARHVSPAVDLDRRRFLQIGAGGIATSPLLISGYGAIHTGRSYQIQELTIPFGLRLRVIQLSDIHSGIFMNRREIRGYTDLVIDLKPDLLVLTGDFISNSLSFLSGCLEELSRVPTPYGSLATLGNHEHWYGRLSEIQRIFLQHRITLLNNANIKIKTEQGFFAVAGIDDLWAGHPDLKKALTGLNATIPTLLLSHRPEIFPLAAASEIPLTLAGHYHGGQIKVRFLGRGISFAHFRTPYPEGLYRLNTSRLYVNRGIGTTFTPVRLNVPPEITVLNLT